MNEQNGETNLVSNVLYWIIILFVIALLVAIITPNLGRRSHTSPACINNMRQIDGAISEWALEKGKPKGTVVTENDITNYIKLNRYGKIPPCPSGGKYTYGKVGDVPQISCSLSTANPPHVLP
jgi:hypothetical protein